MRTIFIQILLVALCTNATAQQSEQAFLDAAAEKGAQEFFYKNSRASSGGYLYVAGASLNDDGHYDMLLTKYSGTTEVWSTSWDGSASGDDYAASIVIDGSGNIIIAGTTEVTSTNYNGVIAKYNTSGTLQWATTYAGNAGLLDGFVSVARDGSNNIYACGGTLTTTEQSNFVTVKYNSSGTQQWASIYDSSDLQDLAVKCVVSGTTVRTSGGSQINADDWKMTTVSYNTSTGAQGSVNQTGGDDEGVDQVRDVWTDGTNTYVVGAVRNTTMYDWKILKLDANLTVTWSATYNGTDNLDDIANSVKVDGAGNVYVTGYTTVTGEGKNFLTRKYNSSGTLQWSKTFHYEQDDEALTLELDANGNVLISGSSYKDGNLDYLTIKYKYTDGTAVWRTDNFNSIYNDDDIPSNIALDESGNIYVIGTVSRGDGKTTYMMCKYVVKTVYTPVPADGYSSSGGYVTNKGQLRNDDGTSNPTVKFYNANHRVATYIENRYISYQLVQGMDTTNADTTFRVRMDFTKGSTTTKVYPLKTRNEYHNYYLGHMSKQSERTEVVNTALRLDSYTKTDVIFTHSPSGFRHWIVARTGAPTGDFEMTFTGQTGLSIDGSGNLLIPTTIGDITFTKAKAYSMNNTTGALTLLGWQPSYSISGSAVSFTSFGSWSGILVLEYGEEVETVSSSVLENVDWSTYYGGTGEDQFKDAGCDINNNVFAFGESESQQFVDQGEQIYSPMGARDAIVVKFNEECENEFVIFYGGSGSDYGRAIEIDSIDFDIYCVGTTTSNDLDNFAGIAMEDGTLGGTQDGYYAKFNSLGELQFHTYVGGNGNNEGVTGVASQFNPFNGQSLIYYVGYTDSGTGWPALVTQTDSYSQAYTGGVDGFIIKRTGADEDVVWSTFFGSNTDDWINDVDLAKGSPVIAGITHETSYSTASCDEPTDGNFPKCFGAGDGSWHQDEFVDNNSNFTYNYFIAWFGDDGDPIQEFSDQLLWSTYVCASGDGAFFINKAAIMVDNFGGFGSEDGWDAYLHGSVPIPNSLDDFEFPFLQFNTWEWHQDTPGSTNHTDGCIFRFRSSGATGVQQRRGTLYGGNQDEYGAGMAMDADKNLFITGQSTINAIQDEEDWCEPPTNGDFPMCDLNGLNYSETNIASQAYRTYVAAFLNSGEMRWSTQYGDGDFNAGNAMSANENKVWVVGYSYGDWTEVQYDSGSETDYYFEYPGSLQPDNQEATIARFDIQTILAIGEVLSGSSHTLTVYPNPSIGLFTFSSDAFSIGEKVQIDVYDVCGKLVESNSLTYRPRSSIDLYRLAKGQYLLKVQGVNVSLSALIQIQ